MTRAGRHWVRSLRPDGIPLPATQRLFYRPHQCRPGHRLYRRRCPRVAVRFTYSQPCAGSSLHALLCRQPRPTTNSANWSNGHARRCGLAKCSVQYWDVHRSTRSQYVICAILICLPIWQHMNLTRGSRLRTHLRPQRGSPAHHRVSLSDTRAGSLHSVCMLFPHSPVLLAW